MSLMSYLWIHVYPRILGVLSAVCAGPDQFNSIYWIPWMQAIGIVSLGLGSLFGSCGLALGQELDGQGSSSYSPHWSSHSNNLLAQPSGEAGSDPELEGEPELPEPQTSDPSDTIEPQTSDPTPDQPSNPIGSQPSNPTEPQTSNQPSDPTEPQTSDQPSDLIKPQTSDQTPDQASDPAEPQTSDQPSDPIEPQTSEQPSDQPSDQSSDQPSDPIEPQTSEQPSAQTSDQPSDQGDPNFPEPVEAGTSAADLQPPSQSVLSVAELVQAAMAATADQNWDQAAQLYRQALDREPNNPGLYNNLGVVLRRLEDLPGSIAAYRQALALDPDLNTTYINLAIALLSNQSWAEALEILIQAQARIENNPGLWLYRGLAHEKLGQWAEAVTAYQTFVEAQPNTLGYHRLAVASWQLGDGSRAVQAFQRAARLNPDVGLYSSEAGLALAKLGLPEEAILFLTRLPQTWSNPDDFVVLARLTYQLDQTDVAEAAIQRAIRLTQSQSTSESAELDPTSSAFNIPAPALLNDAGVIEAEQDDFASATRYLQAAAAQADQMGNAEDQTGAIAYSNLADLYFIQNQLDLALGAAEEALDRDPTWVPAHNTLASVLLSLDQIDAAIDQFENAIQLDPSYWQAHRNLAIAYALSGSADQAVQSLQTAIEQAPTLAIARSLNEELINLNRVILP